MDIKYAIFFRWRVDRRGDVVWMSDSLGLFCDTPALAIGCSTHDVLVDPSRLQGFAREFLTHGRIAPCTVEIRRGALEAAPRVVAWVETTDDLSGLEPSEEAWTGRDAIPDTLRALLGEVGRVYAPFLLANAEAISRGAARVECSIDGRAWIQKPFPYQAKCLGWLREAYGALAREHRDVVDTLLAGTGCERLFAS